MNVQSAKACAYAVYMTGSAKGYMMLELHETITTITQCMSTTRVTLCRLERRRSEERKRCRKVAMPSGSACSTGKPLLTQPKCTVLKFEPANTGLLVTVLTYPATLAAHSSTVLVLRLLLSIYKSKIKKPHQEN